MNSIKIDKEGRLVHITIDNGKVNAINTELAIELRDTFKELALDKSVGGVLLKGREGVFSAGLDIITLATGGIENAKVFWRAYKTMCQELAKFPKPFVCAVNGYAPAGATIIALLADYRVMAIGDKYVMGMHEFKMHLQIPEILCDVYAYSIGEKNAWESVQLAKLFKAEEALKLGLVNEALPLEEVVPAAEKYLKRIAGVMPRVYSDTKAYLRKDLLRILDHDVEKLTEDIIEQSTTPEAQAMVQMFVSSLKNKK